MLWRHHWLKDPTTRSMPWYFRSPLQWVARCSARFSYNHILNFFLLKKKKKIYENNEISWWRSSIKNYYLIWVIWSDDHKTTLNNFITSSQTRHHKFINNKFALVFDAWSVFLIENFFQLNIGWSLSYLACNVVTGPVLAATVNLHNCFWTSELHKANILVNVAVK